jgi:hypothetical protein
MARRWLFALWWGLGYLAVGCGVTLDARTDPR